MAIHIPIGAAPYGQYRDARTGASFATWFYFLAFLPVIPLWGLQVGRPGGYQRAPMRGRSVAVAYLRAYGLFVAAIFTWLACARLAFGEPIGWAYALCGVAVAAVTTTSWFVGRGLTVRRRWLVGLAYAIPIAAIGVAAINEAHGHAEFLASQERMARAGSRTPESRPAEDLAAIEAPCRKTPRWGCSQAGERMMKQAPSRAVSLYELGCTAGDGESCRRLADAYVNGTGVPRDVPKALGWFDKACALKETLACSYAASLRQTR